MKSIGIHIFRKDLRIVDNLALNELNKTVDLVIPIFILDPMQIEMTKNNKHYFSPRAARFILDCLIDLYTQCNRSLNIYYGDPIKIISDLLNEINPKYVSFNADYSKYALERDQKIINLCARQNIQTIINYDDQCLSPMNDTIKQNGDPYMVYGAFYKNAIKYKVRAPKSDIIKLKTHESHFTKIIPINDPFIQNAYNDIRTIFTGGRKYGFANLRNKKSIYGFENRDTLSNHSFEISPYLNFGCFSIREVYKYFKDHSIDAIRELYWRDFFLCILRYKSAANSYTQSIDPHFDSIRWRKVVSKQAHDEWYAFINSSTRFLLIDAGMKQLQQTGYIGNRMRLLLATFWTKYLMIDPMDLEYGAQSGYSRMLTDCSTSNNKLNHQWITELDLSGRRFAMKGKPPLSGRVIRIDNEMITKYDPQLKYLTLWLPQYANKTKKELIATKTIFNWRERYNEFCSRL